MLRDLKICFKTDSVQSISNELLKLSIRTQSAIKEIIYLLNIHENLNKINSKVKS